MSESGGTLLAFTNSGGTLTSITFDGDMDLSQQQGANARIYGGLVLNGTMYLGNAAGTDLRPTCISPTAARRPAAFTGTGTVVLGGWGLGGNYIERRTPTARRLPATGC